MLNNKKNKKQHQGETTMNTFTNNGEFVRPLGYRSHEEVRKDMTVLISAWSSFILRATFRYSR
jgi:hypothetical protein